MPSTLPPLENKSPLHCFSVPTILDAVPGNDCESEHTQSKLCSIIKIITGQDFEKVIRNVPHYSWLTEFIFDPTLNLVLTELECPDLKPVWYIVKTWVYALVLQVLIREEAYVSGVVHSKP